MGTYSQSIGKSFLSTVDRIQTLGYHWNPDSLDYEVDTGGGTGTTVDIGNFPSSYATDLTKIGGTAVGVANPLFVNDVGSFFSGKYDSVTLGYTGANLTSVVYKLAQTTVATLTLGYEGSTLNSVVKN
jgi:hypothetical protein